MERKGLSVRPDGMEKAPFLRIEGARVIDSATGRDGFFDVLIEGEKVIAVDAPGSFGMLGGKGVVINAKGMWVFPGLVDIHVHLREPGEEEKEGLFNGLMAAACGGFTDVCCMPNTIPSIDSPERVKQLIEKSGQLKEICNLYVIAAITVAREGKQIADMENLVKAGAIAFSDDGSCVLDAGIMRRAMEKASVLSVTIAEHAEEKSLTRDGVSHEGIAGRSVDLGGMPAEAEDIITARDIILAKMTGAKLHICHVSSKGTIELIERAKNEGVNVTCEVTPHHLLLTDEATVNLDPNTKVNPPLRSQEHRKALIRGLKEGIIDAVATDHAPHLLSEKLKGFKLAPFGISGLETAVSLMLKIAEEEGISPLTLCRVMSESPRLIMGLPPARIEKGYDADITIIHPCRPYKINPDKFISRGKNTPFSGWSVPGKVYMTIKKGKIAYCEDSAYRT